MPGKVLRVWRQHGFEQTKQAFAPLCRWHGFAQHALVTRQMAQQADQGVECGQRATFQRGPRRNPGNVAVTAAGMAQQQAIQCERPGVGVITRGLVLRAMRRVQPPARAGGLQPAMQALQRCGIQSGGISQRGTGQQIEDLVQAEARHRQTEQTHEHFRQWFTGQRTGVGQGIGNEIVVPVAPAKYRVDIRCVRVDVGGQHRDLACLQRRVEARVFQQATQLVMQHLHFAQRRVAGMHLQAGVVAVQRLAQRTGRRSATMEQVGMQPGEQAVGQRLARLALFGIVIGGDFAGRMHHFVTAQHRHEITTCRVPGLQQAVLTGAVVACQVEGVLRAAAQPLAQGLQVTPVRAGGRGHIEMQHAYPRLGGDDPQHVRRHVQGGEGEQPGRQATGQR